MTAAINSRSPLFRISPEEAEPNAPRIAPRPPSSEQGANRVERWSGPGPSSPAPRSAEAVNAHLDKLMKRDSMAPVRDFFVTERDAREGVAMLGQLPAAEYQKAISTMSCKTLGQLLSEMDPQTRQSFFEQARQKGVVKEEPGVKMPPREGSPPDKPALLRNDASLPVALRTAIHEENKARTSQYMRDFDGYVSRYSAAALAASSPLALRLIGPPVTEFVLTEPGVLGSDKGVPTSLGQGSTDRARAARAANDRISDFAGRTRAGSFSATLEVKAGAEVQGRGVEGTFNASVTDYGKVEHKQRGEARLTAVGGLSAGVAFDGKPFGEVNAGPIRIRHDGTKSTEFEMQVRGLGVSKTLEKTTFSLTPDGVPLGTFATIDEKRGSYGGGVKLGSKLDLGGVGSIEASVKAGFTVQGVAPERLPDIASMANDGIWGPMPELNGNVKWLQIPEARRERLARDGWTPGNWPVG